MFALNLRTVFVTILVLSAFALIAGSSFAKNSNQGGSRPGWGNGDKNHEHIGPPGQSVRPHDDDDEDENENEHGKQGHDDEEDEDDHDLKKPQSTVTPTSSPSVSPLVSSNSGKSDKSSDDENKGRQNGKNR